MSDIKQELTIPIILKETGAGFSQETTVKALKAKIDAIDVGGAGGTSFSLVEYFRSFRRREKMSSRVAETFSTWGIPTAISICEVRQVSATLPLIATGGLRNGIDVIKALALGADMAGIALPFLKEVYFNGLKGVLEYVKILKREIKIAMYLTDTYKIKDLRKIPLVFSPKFKAWLNQRGIKITWRS